MTARCFNGSASGRIPSSTSTQPNNNYSRLLAIADRAATFHGCNIHVLLRSSTPPKVQQADVAFHSPHERCSSRAIEEAIANTRSALAKSLANVLLERLWEESARGGQTLRTTDGSYPSANSDSSPTPPNGCLPLVVLAARAATLFGCDLHLLLQSTTPPKVQQADVAFHYSPHERCSSRVLEEAIAKTRTELAKALANALLQGLWASTRLGGSEEEADAKHRCGCAEPTGPSAAANSNRATTRQEDGVTSAVPTQSRHRRTEEKEEVEEEEEEEDEDQPNPPHCSRLSPLSSSVPADNLPLTPPATHELLPRLPPLAAAASTESMPPTARSKQILLPSVDFLLAFNGYSAGHHATTVPRTTAVATLLMTSCAASAVVSAALGGVVLLANDLPIEFSPNTTTAAASNGSNDPQEEARTTTARMACTHGTNQARRAADFNRWVLSGRYELISRLSCGPRSGGGGGLWQAAHLTTGESLAIKAIPRGTLERRRFRGPPRALIHLFQHPNTIPLLELIDDPSCVNVFLVMPLAKPLPFSLDVTVGRLTAEKPSVDTVLDYARGAASALSVFHAAGIVHGDIRFEKLMILPGRRSSTENGDSLAVTGFGVCQLSVSQDRAHGHVCLSRGGGNGMLAYWAPECFAAKTQSDTFTAASDCYALGLCLYAMAFGQFPYWTPDISNPLAWEKVVPGTARYEGPSLRVTVPTIQTTANHAVLCDVIQRLLAPVAERITAKGVVQLFR